MSPEEKAPRTREEIDKEYSGLVMQIGHIEETVLPELHEKLSVLRDRVACIKKERAALPPVETKTDEKT